MNNIVGNSYMNFKIGNFYSKNYMPITINFGEIEIGTLDDNTYMPSFINILKNLIENPYYFMEEINITNYRNIFSSKNEDISGLYYFSLENTFDDFSKRAVRNRDSIFFCFRLNEYYYFDYKNINNGADID